jgi:predicted nucleic acid-binding Zn ribbon protein
MTDVSDQATIREEQEREACLTTARQPHQRLEPTGLCHWCDEVVEGDKRFCDADCRDMWQRQESARKRAGA